MAKQVEVQKRFRIWAEIAAEELGPTLVQLDAMGLQNVGYELVTDMITFKNNPNRIAHETTGEECARQWVQDHPTFRVLELVQHFRTENRTPGSAYTAVRNLIASDELIKTSPGHYQRSDVRALAAPKGETAEKKKRAPNPIAKYDVPNMELIIRAIKGRKQITSIELAKMFADEERNPKSVSPLITKLIKTKRLETISPGNYRILPTPEKEKDRLRKQVERAAKKEKLNGATHITETTHG